MFTVNLILQISVLFFLYFKLCFAGSSYIIIYNDEYNCSLKSNKFNNTFRHASEEEIADAMRNHVFKTIKDRFRRLQSKSVTYRALDQLKVIGKYHSKLNVDVLSFPDSLNSTMTSELVDELPCVEYITENYVLEYMSEETDYDIKKGTRSRQVENLEKRKLRLPQSSTSNLFSNQWYFDPSFEFSSKISPDYVAWSMSKKARNAKIAIIDTGCNLDHSISKDVAFWKNPNEVCGDGIDNDGNGYIDDCIGFDFANDLPLSTLNDEQGHGSALMGIIAARREGILLGGCLSCRIMCLKFRTNTTARISQLLSAVEYAIEHEADVINMSFGSAHVENYASLRKLEYYMIKKTALFNILVVASAGNTGTNTDEVLHFPSGYTEITSNVLSVGATGQNGAILSWSNFGKNSVDIFAPGSNIYSIKLGNKYKSFSGTSFSTAIVSSIVGQILSRGNFTYKEVKEIIMSSCKTISSDPKGIIDSTAIQSIIDKMLDERNVDFILLHFRCY